MINECGSISISTENIFPIIKKWLYSEKDIFMRELVSNSSDAINKMVKLVAIGEASIPEDQKYEIKVVLNQNAKTIQIVDNGLGMTEDEIKKYINQIAFSGAQDFLSKYKDKTDESQIIGHFGLGFYSSFMVADKVEIDTLSYQEGSAPVRWTSCGGVEYEISQSDRSTRGTTITLHMAEDSLEFLETYKLREILTKYFSFLPYEIYLEEFKDEEVAKKDSEEKPQAEDDFASDDNATDVITETTDAEDTTKENDSEESKQENIKEQEKKAPVPINDTKPLWLKQPKDCTDQEYKDFYKKVFYDYRDPLFWIHLNMDYPFNLKGILYFPKLQHEFETTEGQIKLFYNQVFVADNIKEVIPEFLMLLKGVLDCPDLPLNVSRSFLQNDGYVNKISSHITKKVADKLSYIFENERDDYNKYWDDIGPFVKYGCIKEPKFFEKAKDLVLYKTINDEHMPLRNYLEKNKETQNNKVFYVTDIKQQAHYVKLFKDTNLDAVIFSSMLDNHFAQFLESKETDIQFVRVDSDLSDSLKESTDAVTEEDKESLKKTTESLEKMFKDALGKTDLKLQLEKLKTLSTPGLVIASEQSRRMKEMSRLFGGLGYNPPEEVNLVLNMNNSLIKKLVGLTLDSNNDKDVKLICEHIYDLAMISHKQLEPEAMSKFIERSNIILEKLADLD